MPDPCRDVIGLSPFEQHATALHVLDGRYSTPFGGGSWQQNRDLEGWNGRRRILERHAPQAGSGKVWCQWCIDITYNPGVLWPCTDYRDAAAGLVTGLGPPLQHRPVVDPRTAAAAALVAACRTLTAALVAACPGPHRPTQRRDHRRPWCSACRYDVDGTPVPPKEAT